MRKLVYILLLFSELTFSQVPSFPGAVGFGKQTTGGKGGSVLFVTNLNDSGSGSLRAAVEASGARTVVFRVGGTITLTSNLLVKNPNLTIAGQTAPEGGILIRGRLFQVEASNVIVRYMRFRLGADAPADMDAFSITAWANKTVENVYLDHCSFSWGVDENLNIRASDMNTSVVRNISVTNCIMAENGKNMLMYQNVQNISLWQNMTILTVERNFRANYGFENVFKFEMVNNIIYGWKNAATNASNGQKYTVLNNKYKISSSFSTDFTTVIDASAADSGVPDSWTYAYISGNIIPSGYTLNNSRVSPYIKSTPWLSSGLTDSAYPASQIEDKILNNVGASLPTRDAVDTRLINSYNAGTGTIAYTGTYPTINNGTPYPDSDLDGMDDIWEASVFGNLSKGNNGYDLNSNYTNLQMFLSYKANDSGDIPPPIDNGGNNEISIGAGSKATHNYLLTN